jgi:hypothetical protein
MRCYMNADPFALATSAAALLLVSAARSEGLEPPTF